MRKLTATVAGALPAGAPYALIFGYVGLVALARRERPFDLPFHVIVLLLIGFAVAGATPFREVATAMLTTLLVASTLAYLFGPGARDRRPASDRKFVVAKGLPRSGALGPLPGMAD